MCNDAVYLSWLFHLEDVMEGKVHNYECETFWSLLLGINLFYAAYCPMFDFQSLLSTVCYRIHKGII